jgi:hypothetical protein
MFKKYRKSLSLTPDGIISAIGASGKSAIYYLEKSYLENKLFNYLVLLRSKGVDMNEFIDQIIRQDYPQYIEEINKIDKNVKDYLQNDFEERLVKLEEFRNAVILKFKIDIEIEKEEEKIMLKKKKTELKEE